MEGLVILKRFNNRIEAESFKELLNNNNIYSVVDIDDVGGMDPHFNTTKGVEVLVMTKDFIKAKKIIMDMIVQNEGHISTYDKKISNGFKVLIWVVIFLFFIFPIISYIYISIKGY